MYDLTGGSFVSEFKHITMNYGNHIDVPVSTGEGNPNPFVEMPRVFGIDSLQLSSAHDSLKCVKQSPMDCVVRVLRLYGQSSIALIRTST